MSRVRRSIGDDPPRKIVRKSGDPPRDAWVKIEQYPELEEEWIRGVDVFRTKEPWPLRYRVVISAFFHRGFRIPAVIGIKNERRIRFGHHPVEFGLLQPGESRVSEWRTELPDFKNKDVIISNPDFVRMTSEWEKA